MEQTSQVPAKSCHTSSYPMGNLCSLLESVGPGFPLGFGLGLGLFSPKGPDQGVSQAALGLETSFALRQIIVNTQTWNLKVSSIDKIFAIYPGGR